MEEVVGERVLRGEPPERQLPCVVGSHYQTADVGPGDEAVHLSAVDLKLLLVETVHRIADRLVRRRVRREIEGPVHEVRREARVDHRGRLRVVHRARQRDERVAGLVELRCYRACLREAIGSRKAPVETVEAPVLEVDDDDVPDLFDAWGWRSRDRPGRCAGREK